jgi:hypothetical protein
MAIPSGDTFTEVRTLTFAIFDMLHIVAAASVVIAVYFAYKLYRETDRAWYWLSLLMSAFFFALAQWIQIIFPGGPRFAVLGILSESSGIIATLLFAISCYGIYKTMKDIRKRVE